MTSEARKSIARAAIAEAKAKARRDLDLDPKDNLRVALSWQRDVAGVLRDCCAETGRFRFEKSRLAVLDAASRLFDELDRLIDELSDKS